MAPRARVASLLPLLLAAAACSGREDAGAPAPPPAGATITRADGAPRGGPIVVVSDTHVSSPAGRWYEQNAVFEGFLAEIEATDPALVFFVGDVIDNMPVAEWPHSGSEEYCAGEWTLFRELMSRHPLPYRCAYGRGHDYPDYPGSEVPEFLRRDVGPENGVLEWSGLDLVWFDVYQRDFSDGDPWPRPALREPTYAWLEETLSRSRPAVLFFHVPVRTPETEVAGAWEGGRNLTIDPRDDLYRILREHRAKIRAIFNGHIHQAIEGEWEGIPLFTCPLMSGTYCELRWQGGDVQVTRRKLE